MNRGFEISNSRFEIAGVHGKRRRCGSVHRGGDRVPHTERRRQRQSQAPNPAFIECSQSLHAHAAMPPVAVIVSMDCDLYARAHPEKADVLRQRLGRDTPFHREHGFYVDGVNPDQIQLAEGWEGRLRPVLAARMQVASESGGL